MVIDMTKLVVSDLDGTLLCNHQVSQENLQAIKKLNERGIAFTVATGRHKRSAEYILKQLDLDLPVLCNNGAQIVDPKTMETLEAKTIEKKTLQKLLDYMEEEKYEYMLTTDEGIFLTEHMVDAVFDEAGKIPIKVTSREDMREVASEDILKLLVVEFDEDKMEKIYRFSKKFSTIDVVISASGFLNIGSKQASKGLGLKYLEDYTKIPLKDMFTIGDQENDLSMIQAAGKGVAMGNASALLKRHAKLHTKTNCEHGFKEAIDTYVLK